MKVKLLNERPQAVVERPKRRTISKGFSEYEFINWASFVEYIQTQMIDYEKFVYRGQRDSEWPLETSFERLCNQEEIPEDERHARMRSHLETFRKAIRGRYDGGQLGEDDLWTLGQHYGLATPLLDWTESPFVAAYFAFCDPTTPESDFRAVWSLYTPRLVKEGLITVIDPDTAYNFRLLSQRGLLTKVNEPGSLEDHTAAVYKKLLSGGRGLMKFLIPNSERNLALKSLNRMNINHMSLFPDLEGSSQYANLKLQIPKY